LSERNVVTNFLYDSIAFYTNILEACELEFSGLALKILPKEELSN
jgi:hypothetical protein